MSSSRKLTFVNQILKIFERGGVTFILPISDTNKLIFFTRDIIP